MVDLIKKIALFAVALFGVVYGYQYMTGKSITELPGEIVARIQNGPKSEQATPGSGQSTNPRYLQDPIKRSQELK